MVWFRKMSFSHGISFLLLNWKKNVSSIFSTQTDRLVFVFKVNLLETSANKGLEHGIMAPFVWLVGEENLIDDTQECLAVIGGRAG